MAAIRAGRGNQYPPGLGVPELRLAIGEHQQRFCGLTYDPDTEVLVTAGATEAIAAALLALLEPGDEVIAFEPFYDSYAACIAMAGATRVPMTLRAPSFRPDLDELRALITPKTRLLLLNSPHNPTGMVLTADEVAAIAAIADRTRPARGHRRGLRAPRLRRRPPPDRRPARHARAHRLDLVVGQDVLVHRLEGRLGHGVAGAGRGGPGGQAVPDLRECRPVPVRHRRSAPPARRLLRGLPARPDAQARPAGRGPDGGRVRRVHARRDLLHHDRHPLTRSRPTASTFCHELPARCGVVAIPNVVFYDNVEVGRSQVRFTFCKRPEVLEEAVTRLKRL